MGEEGDVTLEPSSSLSLLHLGPWRNYDVVDIGTKPIGVLVLTH